jgi:FO synthase subunit 1
MDKSPQKIITYSPAYTLVPTYECFNRCHYCNFRTNPGQSPWLTVENAKVMLTNLQSQGVIEILILSGEVHPQSKRRKAWLQRIYDLAQLALSMGFLPHTNVGPLSFEEMSLLKQVNVSMGLMLEQLTPKLLETVHRHAPSKLPSVRIQQLEWAGKLKIPFTTGILLGIGETDAERRESLEAIARLHHKWGHIQEVILQPYSPGTKEEAKMEVFNPDKMPEIIAEARKILPASITIQIPPNLVLESSFLLNCLEAGARDLGGISPKDEVNPNYPHPHLKSLTELLSKNGWQLKPRLPVYPQYHNCLPEKLLEKICWVNKDRGLSSIKKIRFT